MYERIPVYAIQLWTFEMKEILFTNIPEEIQFTTTNRSVEFNDINIINILNLKAKLYLKWHLDRLLFTVYYVYFFTDSLFPVPIASHNFNLEIYIYVSYIHWLSPSFACSGRNIPRTFQGLSVRKSRTGRPRDFPGTFQGLSREVPNGTSQGLSFACWDCCLEL